MRKVILAPCAAALMGSLVWTTSVHATVLNIEETASGFDNADMLYTYSPSGTQLSAVAIPNSPKGYDQPHDLVVDKAGNVQVVYGGPYLATYNGSSWTFHSALNYSLFGVTYTGAVATYNNYVYCQSQNSSGSGNGIVRFDTSNNNSTTFTQVSDGHGGFYEPQDVSMGMDGNLYANYYVGGVSGHLVVEFNPNTMAVIKTVTLNASNNEDGDHTVVDSQGNIYVDGLDWLNKYSPNGTFISQIPLTGEDGLAISSTNMLLAVQNDTAYEFDTNLNEVSATAIQGAYWGEPFAAFASYQAPASVPEPATGAIALIACGACCLIRRRRRERGD